MPDEDLLETIKRNMRPGLEIALTNHFISSCIPIESVWNRLGYVPELFF